MEGECGHKAAGAMREMICRQQESGNKLYKHGGGAKGMSDGCIFFG